LHSAAADGHRAVVELLLREMDPETIGARDEWWGQTALHWAAVYGHGDVVALLLRRMNPETIGAQTKDGQTALHLAAEYGHGAVVELLEKWERDHGRAKRK
jgi:Ankyrin repeats (3 copies)